MQDIKGIPMHEKLKKTITGIRKKIEMKTYVIIMLAIMLIFDAVGFGILEASLSREIWNKYKTFAYKMVYIELATMFYLIIF